MRANAFRAAARSKHCSRRHVYAPRPAIARRGAWQRSVAATKRTSSACGARRPQPAQSGSGRRHAAAGPSSSGASRALGLVGLFDGCRRRVAALARRPRRSSSGSVVGRRLDDLVRDVLAAGLRSRELLVRRHAAEARCREARCSGSACRVERIAAQRPMNSSSSSPPKAASASSCANSVSDLISTFQPDRRAARRAFEALLADRERELVVGDDHGRLARVVVDVDLAHACRRERLGDEARRLGVPRDDVDLLAAELGDDHAHARAARADAGADRVDALRVRLDGDLRAVARLARDRADLDEAVGDLGHLELEQRPDQLRDRGARGSPAAPSCPSAPR